MIQKLSKLIQLYMLGVQALQSNWDIRYKYFNEKIQSLMKKKHIVQELHVVSTGNSNTPDQALREADKQHRQILKSQFEINVFLNTDQCNIKRIKQIVQKEQVKYAAYENKIKAALDNQNSKINERIQRRKMKSQCYSSRGFDLGSNPSKEKQKGVRLKNDDIFQQANCRGNNVIKSARRGSAQKKKMKTIKI